MPESFDPYRKWLGIPPEDQPANFYRLLGIAVFEDDPDVIAYAADRQMSHVRKFQSGQNGQQAQKLLSELAQARRCLLSAKERAAYDRHLQKTFGKRSSNRASVAAPQPAGVSPMSPVAAPIAAPPSAGPAAPPAPPIPPQAAPPVATLDPPRATAVADSTAPKPVRAGPVVAAPVAAAARHGRRRNSALPLMAALIAMAVLACVVLIVALAYSLNDEPGTRRADDRPKNVRPANNVPPREEKPASDHRSKPRSNSSQGGAATTAPGKKDVDGTDGGAAAPDEAAGGNKSKSPDADGSPLPQPSGTANGDSTGASSGSGLPDELIIDAPKDLPPLPDDLADPKARLPKPGGDAPAEPPDDAAAP